MSATWAAISLDPRYDALSAEDKSRMQELYWNRKFVSDPRFQSLNADDKQKMRLRFESETRDIPQPVAKMNPLYDDPQGIQSRMSYLRRIYLKERQGVSPQTDKYFNELPTEYQREFLTEWEPAFGNMPQEKQTLVLNRIAQDWTALVERLEETRKSGAPMIGEAMAYPQPLTEKMKDPGWWATGIVGGAFATALKKKAKPEAVKPLQPPPELEKRRSFIEEVPSTIASALIMLPRTGVTLLHGLSSATGDIFLPTPEIEGYRGYDRQAEWTRRDWTEPNYWTVLTEENEYLRTRGISQLDATRPLKEKLLDPYYLGRAGANFAVQMAVSMAAYAATGGAAGLGSVGGFLSAAAMEGGQAGETAFAAGATPKQQLIEMLSVGTINGILEFLPMENIIVRMGRPAVNGIKRGAIASARRIITAGVQQGLYEGVTEGLQEVVQIAAAKLGHGEDQTFDQYTERVLESMLLGGVFGGLSGGVSQGVAEVRISQVTNQIRQDAAQILGLPPDASMEAIEAGYQDAIRAIEQVEAIEPEAIQDKADMLETVAIARDVLVKPTAMPVATMPIADEYTVRNEPMANLTIPQTKSEILAIHKWYKDEAISITPSKLLQYAMKHEAKGARIGYRVGQIEARAARRTGYRTGQTELIATHADIITFAENALPKSEYQLVVRALKAISKTRTPGSIRAVIRSVNLMVANYERASAVAEYHDAMKRMKKRLKRLKISLRPEFQSRLDDLTDAFRLTATRASTKARFESILKAAELDEIGEIPQKLIDRAQKALADENKPLLRQMEPNEIRAITNSVLNIFSENLHKNRLLASQKHSDAKKAIAETVAAIKRIHGEKITEVTRRKPVVHVVTGAQLSHDVKVSDLVGEEGAGYDILNNNLHDANNDFIALQRHASDTLDVALENAGVSLAMARKWSDAIRRTKVSDANMVTVELPTAVNDKGARVPTLKLTVAGAMEIFLLNEDPQNRAEMLRDVQQGITFDRDPLMPPTVLKAADLQAIRDALTPEQKQIAQVMFQYVNGPTRTATNHTSVAEFGFEIWPRLDYWRRGRDPEFLKTDPSAMIQNARDSLFEDFSIYKPRTASPAPIQIGDAFETFRYLVSRSSAYATKTKAVHDAIRLVTDRSFRQQVLRSVPHGNDVLDDIQQSIRSYVGTEIVHINSAEKAVGGFVQRAHIGALVLKPAIVAYQKISLLNAMTEIEWTYLARSLIPSPKQTHAEISAYSPSLWARITSNGHQLMTPGSGASTLANFYFPHHKGYQERLMRPIVASDAGVIHIIWRAAQLKMIDQGFSGEELMRQTAREAERITDRTQPARDTLTISQLAQWSRKQSYLKLLATMFSTGINANINVAARGWSRWKRSDKGARDFAALTTSLVIPLIVNPMCVYAIQYGVRRGWEKAWGVDDDDKPEVELINHVEGVMSRAFGQWLIVGDSFNLAARITLRAVMKNPSHYTSLQRNMMAETAENAFSSLADVVNSFFLAAEQEHDKALAARIDAAERAVDVISIAFGQPLQGLIAPFKPLLKEMKKELRRASF